MTSSVFSTGMKNGRHEHTKHIAKTSCKYGTFLRLRRKDRFISSCNDYVHQRKTKTPGNRQYSTSLKLCHCYLFRTLLSGILVTNFISGGIKFVWVRWFWPGISELTTYASQKEFLSQGEIHPWKKLIPFSCKPYDRWVGRQVICRGGSSYENEDQFVTHTSGHRCCIRMSPQKRGAVSSSLSLPGSQLLCWLQSVSCLECTGMFKELCHKQLLPKDRLQCPCTSWRVFPVKRWQVRRE